MTTEATTTKRIHCPSCGKEANRVSTVTLGALLKDEFAEPFAADGQPCCNSSGDGCQPVTNDTGWRFCDSADCDVVYFSETGDTRFTNSQLKVPVGVKQTMGERPLCYCFGHSVACIKDELRTKGRSDALQDIRAKMKDPGCHCETTNPSGSCCLGSVTKGIRTAQQELEMNDTSRTAATPETGEATLSERRGQQKTGDALVQPTSMQPTLFDLSADIGELRQAFNVATGKVRILLLVSPG